MTVQASSNRNSSNAHETTSRINEFIQAVVSRLEDNLFVAWLITKNTLTVVAMALLILSPMIVWPFLMNWPVPYCYIAYAIWISWFVGATILTGVIGYMREKRGG